MMDQGRKITTFEKTQPDTKVLSNWNVVDKDTFRTRVRAVFDVVAGMLKNTLGPSGSNTIIEKFGDVHITKDGWNILKKIQFSESIDNTIMHLLVNIAAQVVIKVGDGSTSSIVAANQLLKSIESEPELRKIRPKELIESLTRVAEKISSEILNRSKKVNIETEEGLDEIFRLALVSTNGDDRIANMIKCIYRETKNPSIEYIKSKTNRTYYEIIDGYQAPISYINPIYINNAEDGTCEINNPLILMFDHRIDKENHFDHVIQHVLNVAMQANRRLVVIAPRFDDTFLKYIRTVTDMEVKATRTTQVVYARASLVNNLHQEYFNDFAIMAGARVFRESDMMELLGINDPSSNNEEESVDDNKEEKKFVLDDYVGEVKKITLGHMDSTISGFINRNDALYEIALKDAIAKYKRVEATNMELNVPNPEIYELKKRVSKLSGKMGVIHVGGNSSLEKVANFDLVEDAVRACESAFNYGYNIGGNLIIPIVINDILKTVTDENERRIYELFSQAFRSVFSIVLKNRYYDWEDSKIMEIVDKSIELQKVYNLITEEFSSDIINPCFTDMEITKAATSIIALIMGSNQFLTINTDTEI